MIAALFALAAAMIIGGCAAVVQGFPYVRLESGLAMVIAGSVAASSGAILCGLGVLALGLRRIERSGALLADQADAPAVAPAPDGGSRTRLPPILPPAPAFMVPPPVEPALDPQRSRPGPDLGVRTAPPAGEPSFGMPPPLTMAEPTPLAPGPDLRIPAAPAAPAPVFAPKPDPVRPDPPRPAAVIAPEDDLFAPPEASKDAPPALRPGLDTVPDPEPAATPAPRTVVGRYASGGNTYVMFEDGSIEAETPQGRFTFASLDELKAFVDGGGESGTRGAA